MDLDTIVQSTMTFIKEHRAWAAPVVFILAFFESIAFMSLVLPFWGMLVAIGTVISATGGADFWVVTAAAALGAALGDWVSYWIGYHYHEQIARMWPINRYPNLIPQGHQFFEKWGAGAIWLGRFSGPLRASIPIIAGAVQMPRVKFQIANWGSAVLWAVVLMFFGDALGQVWTAIHSQFGR
jgi:membrane protein DedA with SNARE-associated domain